MADTAAPKSAVSSDPSNKKFLDMSLLEKGTFVVKAMVFLVTFGFAFPNIFVD